MIMKDRRPYLARLLAVDLVLLAAGAMNAARAEDAAPVSIHSGKGDSSSIRDAPAKGIDKTTPTSTPTIKSTATAGAQESTTPVQRMA
jgi:hypothetical protein